MTNPELTPLVEIAQQHIALLFSDFLNSEGIASSVQANHQRFIVLVDGNQLDKAHSLFAEFIKQPDAAKYQQVAWQQGQVVELAQQQNASFFRQFIAHGGRLTLIVFTLCWLVFLTSLFGVGRELVAAIKFYKTPELSMITQEPWRLIGPIFIHFSWLHIVFNTMWWWQLGGAIEKELGKGELLQLLLLSALCSNLGQYLATGPNFGGLSGVVYALVGYVWWAGWLAPERGLMLSKPVIGFLLIWLMLGFTEVLPINMGNAAHLLGLISGCLLAFWRFKIKQDASK